MIHFRADFSGDIHRTIPDPRKLVKEWRTACDIPLRLVAGHSTNLRDVTCPTCLGVALVGDLIRSDEEAHKIREARI